MKHLGPLSAVLLLAPLIPLHAADSAAVPHATDWLKEARLGAFMHFWPNRPNEMVPAISC